MIIKSMLYGLTCLLALSVGIIGKNSQGQVAELGQYPLYNFSPKDYGEVEQNWCAVQDHRGIMYFGNNHGVLEYDGKNWSIIPPETSSPVKSIAVDNRGRIYFGAENEFGYLVPDSLGNMDYHRLSDRLSEENSEFSEVWATHITDWGIVFQAYHHLFIWNDDSLHAIFSEAEIHESFKLGNRVFISYSDSRLSVMEHNEIRPVLRAGFLPENSVYGMIETSPDNIILFTDTDGFFRLLYNPEDPGSSKYRRIITGNDDFFKKIEIFNAITLSQERISLGTWGYGCVIIDTLFNIISIIDKEVGLQDQIIQGQYVDGTGNLWLALSSGISRVEPLSALTQFSDNQGIMGTVQAITRFDGKIMATTNVGLFHSSKGYQNEELSEYRRTIFTPHEGIDVECWDMITYRNQGEEILLFATNTRLYQITKDWKTNSILEEYIYDIYQSKLDPNRVYIGLENGLTSIYRNNGKWEKEEYIEGIDDLVQDMSEDHMGNLWMGTFENNLYKLYIENFEDHKIGEYTVTKYSGEDGLPEGPFMISQFKGPPTIATNKGLYKYNLIEESFKPDSTYGDQFGNGSLYIHRITEYKVPDIWLVSIDEDAEEFKYMVGYLDENESGSYIWVNEPFNRLSEELIHGLYLEENGVVWLGGSQGLFRFQKDALVEQDGVYNAYIRGIELSGGRKIFAGAYSDNRLIQSLVQPDFMKQILPYRDNSLVFQYSAQPAEDESFTRYSYFLEGNDQEWSEWTSETYRPYTNLREGKYIFRVKAKNVKGQISSEATYEFTILAPWYRKWWAYIIYVILASVIVYTIVTVYTRQLREIIRERTAEVVAQKEVIEEKNKDIMDSIQYAQKIQRALLPPEDDLGKLDLDGFILFLPRDVVSGDFYWLAKHEGKIITVAADCTGHGVPGAFMSMLGVAFLNNIVGAQGITKSNEILNELRAEVIAALKQKGHEGEQKDGMDLALHVIDYKNMTIDFSGANNPLILIRNDELIQIKGDRMPIGIHELADQSFVNHEMEAIKGDVLYTFSDGYQDQFGGPKNKKFMIKKMKELFLEIHKKPMQQQKEILEKAFYDWIVPYNAEQVDDVILIGIRI